MKTKYSFSVLRYIHDVVSGEFCNVGILIYAPDANYLNVQSTKKYGRLSQIFIDVDGSHFRSLMKHIDDKVAEYSDRFKNEFKFTSNPKSILEIINHILPKDDSSLQFSEPGGGITKDCDKTLEELYRRYVDKYEQKAIKKHKDDEDIWKTFRKPLREYSIYNYLKPHKIAAKDYEYEFKYAIKNDSWRTLEPVSFDMEDHQAMLDKANKWFGRVFNLQESEERFKLYFLIGEPEDDQLKNSYLKAENIINKIVKHYKHELVKEREAEEFVKSFREELKQYLDINGE
jgi:hypothetical protein